MPKKIVPKKIVPKKIVLAYSGGLDTTIILRWLQEQYEAELVTFTAYLGQEDAVDFESVRQKARSMGVKACYIEDLREEFVRDYVFPMFRANTLYEGRYLLGTAIARPLIAKRQAEIARLVGADALAHGATGKGNDQVRFELGYCSCAPELRVIAPWREWDLRGRQDLVAWARARQMEVPLDKEGEPPYSRDVNLLHASSEGKALEDPAEPPPESTWIITTSPEEAPDKPQLYRA